MSDLPRVTTILDAVGLGPDFSVVPPEVLAAAQKRGTAVHEAIEAHAYGYLDDAAVDPEIAPYLDAYRKFMAESGHEAIVSEVEVVHPTWQYVGHLDRVGWLLNRRCLLDWKSGEAFDERAAALQVCAYRMAYNASHPDALVDLTGVVQLRSDGRYRLFDIAAHEHEQTFLAALVVYRALPENRR